jgi:peptide deformylase
MATRGDIITLPNKALRQKSQRVSVVNKEIKDLLDDMIEASLDWEDHHSHEICVGLAAVQINRHKKVVIIRSEEPEQRDFGILINPRLIKTYGELEVDFEGCLSVAGIYGLVPRYPKIKFSALDHSGKEFRSTVDGFMARLIQHEIDHCEGKMFVDLIKDDRDAFNTINSEGKIEKLSYDNVLKSGILR